MRIISGKYKGQRFETPKGHRTHPMGDRIKVALFNTISKDLNKARVLDAYTGSGALGFEAYSRGASFVQLIDKDFSAYKCASQNIQELGWSGRDIKLSHANCSSWSDNNLEQKFDVIFVDPPYNQLNLSTLQKLTRHLSDEGLMVLSHTGRETVPTVIGVVVVDNRMYGDAALSYYRKAKWDH